VTVDTTVSNTVAAAPLPLLTNLPHLLKLQVLYYCSALSFRDYQNRILPTRQSKKYKMRQAFSTRRKPRIYRTGIHSTVLYCTVCIYQYKMRHAFSTDMEIATTKPTMTPANSTESSTVKATSVP